MIKNTVKIRQRGIQESIVEITFSPQTDKEMSLIHRAKEARLNSEEYEYFNNLLISICLNNNFSPIAPAGEEGKSFYFRVVN